MRFSENDEDSSVFLEVFDSHVYENWFIKHGTCPTTRMHISTHIDFADVDFSKKCYLLKKAQVLQS